MSATMAVTAASCRSTPPYIFSDLASAIQFCKRFKKQARFRELSSRAAAEQFSLRGDVPLAIDGIDGEQRAENVLLAGNLGSLSSLGQAREDKLKLIGEKCAFRAPKPQDLVRLRRVVLDDDRETLRSKVWDNPRLLIGSGDNPTIVHEGARYNVFHCAAKSGLHEVIEELIRLLRSETLFRRLYPEDDQQTTKQRMAFLLGLYLNIPDKTKRANTPLHFASALGHVRCVEVMVRQPECNAKAVNGDGQTPFDIAGDNATGTAEDKERAALAIRKLLSGDKVVIPILRDAIDLSEPELGCPLVAHSPSFDYHDPPSPAAMRQAQHSPTTTGRKSPAAFIGPVSAIEAKELAEQLKKTKRESVQMRRTDPDKGIEATLRTLARQRGLGWNEFWPFLNSWADLSSGAGLAIFDNYLLSTIRAGVRKHDRLNNISDVNFNKNLPTGQYGMVEGRNGVDSSVEQMDASDKVQDQSATTELIKQLYNFINDILDDIQPLELPKSLFEALPRSDHITAANDVVQKLFISHYERAHVCSHLAHIMDSSADPRLDCVFSALKGALEGRGEDSSPCGCSNLDDGRSSGDCQSEPEDMDYSTTESSRETPTPEELSRLGFITGPLPTRTDYQVWLAIEPVRRLPSETCFPCVHRWIIAMSCFQEDQMRVWKSPQVFRGRVSPHVQTPRPKFSRALGSPISPLSAQTFASPVARDPARMSLLSMFTSPGKK
ncbi:ankyrin repeat and LEM domain-containing protein 2-like isoform X2 [Varroa jacobsoni]|uniref:ankyrin repeat and LEM domain-containing protein 2-like isoform X2 n=1 Tax=Varroa jacobsoni TaxID=62625 RepID=UPI000BF4F901|nr:ankyrin repeat and LEM domain-containing protein 2-like isoform X2 [Varroa jacobsoni]